MGTIMLFVQVKALSPFLGLNTGLEALVQVIESRAVNAVAELESH